MDKLRSESETLTLNELSEEIRNTELKLKKLRDEYISRSGVLPPRSFQDNNWRWTIYMTLGIAYITFITYFFGIKQSGRGEGFWIPDFLYNAEVQFYGVLSFFVIFAIVNIQNRRLRGYQVLTLIGGFWCAHWFLYDWIWWAMEFGFGHEDITFWVSEFYSPLLIAKPPMWLFLTLAVFGVGMSVYTFTVPDNYKKLIPTVIWLYAVYMNGLVCEMLGLSTPVALTIGLVIIVVSFALMMYYSAQKIQKKRQENKETNESAVSKRGLSFKKIWFVSALLFLILSTYVFSVAIPLVGFILGMITWYIIPLLFFVVNATPFQKLSKKKKIVVILFAIIGIALIALFLALAMPILR